MVSLRPIVSTARKIRAAGARAPRNKDVLIEVVAIVRVSHARGWVFAGHRVYARSVTASWSVEFVAAADAVHL